MFYAFSNKQTFDQKCIFCSCIKYSIVAFIFFHERKLIRSNIDYTYKITNLVLVGFMILYYKPLN